MFCLWLLCSITMSGASKSIISPHRSFVFKIYTNPYEYQRLMCIHCVCLIMFLSNLIVHLSSWVVYIHWMIVLHLVMYVSLLSLSPLVRIKHVICLDSKILQRLRKLTWKLQTHTYAKDKVKYTVVLSSTVRDRNCTFINYTLGGISMPFSHT